MTARGNQALMVIDGRETLLKAASMAFAVVVALGLGGAELPLWLAFAAACLLCSWAQQALLEEVHDGVHVLLFAGRAWNDRLSGLYASLIGMSFPAFRDAHLRHHKHFGRPQDPDFYIYSECPVGVPGWLRFTATYFLGVHALARALRGEPMAGPEPRSLQHPLGTLLIQAAVFGLFAAAAGSFWYGFAWGLPLLTLTYGMVKLRTLLEHWDGQRDAEPGALRGALWNLSGPVQAHLLAAQFGYRFHANHHFFAGIPNHRLSRVDLGVRPDARTEVMHGSYFSRLREVFRDG